MDNELKSILKEQSYFWTPIFSQYIYEEPFVKIWKLERYPVKTKVYENILRQKLFDPVVFPLHLTAN
mgnify:CR=1 FL=1